MDKQKQKERQEMMLMDLEAIKISCEEFINHWANPETTNLSISEWIKFHEGIAHITTIKPNLGYIFALIKSTGLAAEFTRLAYLETFGEKNS